MMLLRDKGEDSFYMGGRVMEAPVRQNSLGGEDRETHRKSQHKVVEISATRAVG